MVLELPGGEWHKPERVETSSIPTTETYNGLSAFGDRPFSFEKEVTP
jgi:hypothetical protein